MLRISTGVASTLTVNREPCTQALDVEMLATDVAYYLVRKGVPFRIAHELSGHCVRTAEEAGCTIQDLSLDQLKTIAPEFDVDIEKVWDFENSVEQYNVVGGTARSSVEAQIMRLRDSS